MNALVVRDLVKRFGDLTAVDHVSFDVEEGEIFGFLGPNGAGKTTTVRLMTGVLRADSGSAEIMGHDVIRSAIAAREKIGVVPELANPYEDLSGWSNLMIAAGLYSVPAGAAQRRAEELLRLLGILERKDDNVSTYSKGMRQRLILVMALIHEPPVIFLDEPTSGLDVMSTRTIRGFIQDLRSQGTTVFMTTHNIPEAEDLCDRVAIINKGIVAAVDKPEHLRRTFKGSQAIEVAFEQDVNVEDLESLKGVSRVRRLGDRFRLYTSDLGDLATRVVLFAKERDLSLSSINTLGPSLEDVFVQLTSREEET